MHVLTRIFAPYNMALAAYPFPTKCATAGVLGAAGGNVLSETTISEIYLFPITLLILFRHYGPKIDRKETEVINSFIN